MCRKAIVLPYTIKCYSFYPLTNVFGQDVIYDEHLNERHSLTFKETWGNYLNLFWVTGSLLLPKPR